MIERKLSQVKVLVTGAAGFIGSNLVEDLLKHDNQVVGFDNYSTGKRSNIEPFLSDANFTFIEGDIRDLAACKQACEGVDFVLHQAALGSVPRSIDDPITTNEVNVGGFLNMLVAARDAKVQRFVYAASSSTYGDEKRLPKVEEKVGRPLSPYAVTKAVNEHYAKVFGDLYGMETIGLRYFNVFGPKQDPDGAYAAAIPKFIKRFMHHEAPTIHGDGTQSRDFTFIENVIQANHIAALSTNPVAVNEVYNVAYGQSTNLNELLDVLQTLLSAFDPDVANIKVLHGPERQGDVRHSLASIVKASTLLGYKPEYDLKQGLEKAIDWYWNNLK
ncbi:MAG: SDR family oxidoreductase [Salibacteraceae bacterium]|jgi:UDP-N-acetylglucosamine/UDP-N-acetylgalactosamine 4-epimerase|nr:SDR family oxidoreductase [Salibacteraceae bacterium]MDP4686484.1 SDR family oxidoreductase [Salibacteraceae bacterium]MDP4933973.1 SDR family oxidoreductase [Salibacteraceae bacterium]